MTKNNVIKKINEGKGTTEEIKQYWLNEIEHSNTTLSEQEFIKYYKI